MFFYHSGMLSIVDSLPDSAKKVRVLACLRTCDLTVFFSQLVMLLSMRPELASEMSGHLEHYLFVNSYELSVSRPTE